MASENEPAKLLLPYLQRADELQKHDPLVAYYCRFYAMELGLKIPQSDRTKTTNALLVSLIKQLEKDKKSLKLGPDDHLHVEGFALNVFTKADKQDRAGRADLNTAKTFYAASIFFEILNQFGELQPDLEQKQKYAAWKAADIRKAVKEGRKPVPGPPGGDDDLSLPSTTSGSQYDVEPSKSDFATGPDPIRPDPPAINSPRSDSSPHEPYNQDNFQHPTNIPPQHSNVTPSISPTISQMPVYPTGDYPPDNFHQPPSSNIPENSIYHQPYQHQTEPEHHFSQHYPSHDIPSYPNLQSYPSFTEISLPTVPTHNPSYHQVSSPSITTSYPSTAHYSSNAGNGNVLEASPNIADKYEYDSSYQPPPEKIAEAHKAARFAVGALAFDDVSSAIDYLKKSLELLTNPAARH